MADDIKELQTINPAMDMGEYRDDRRSLMELVKKGMHKDLDYGIIPGTKGYSLLQPGAEKLAKYFGLVPTFTVLSEVEDYDHGFIYYKVRCELTHFKTGKHAGESQRSSNSKEKSFKFDTIYDVGNKVLAKAQKRALVASVRLATMASEIFYEGHDEDDNITAPNAPVTEKLNPERVRIMSTFFAVAKDRGFEPDNAKEIARHKFNVDSVTKISNKDISEMTENLTLKYRIVKSGEKPQLIPVQKTKDTKVEEKKEEVKEAEIVQKDLKCYICNKPLTEDNTFNKYYCSPDCDQQNYLRMHPKEVTSTKLNKLIGKDK